MQLVIAAVLLLSATPLAAQTWRPEMYETFVYRVRVTKAKNSATPRIQTGFRAKGEGGILTALHGVADAEQIFVSSYSGMRVLQPVRVVKVDVSRDLALLSNDELRSAPDEGLSFSTWSEQDWLTHGDEDMLIVGHPEAIDLDDKKVRISASPLVELGGRLGTYTDLRDKLIARNSPDPRKLVVAIDGHLSPGHSGAPLIDGYGAVVAVGNGGLGRGSGISWAIPLFDRKLVNADTSKALDLLEGKSPDGLFNVLVRPSISFDPTNLELELRGTHADMGTWPVGIEARARVMVVNESPVRIGVGYEASFKMYELPRIYEQGADAKLLDMRPQKILNDTLTRVWSGLNLRVSADLGYWLPSRWLVAFVGGGVAWSDLKGSVRMSAEGGISWPPYGPVAFQLGIEHVSEKFRRDVVRFSPFGDSEESETDVSHIGTTMTFGVIYRLY